MGCWGCTVVVVPCVANEVFEPNQQPLEGRENLLLMLCFNIEKIGYYVLHPYLWEENYIVKKGDFHHLYEEM
jgi:hypothetical protein